MVNNVAKTSLGSVEHCWSYIESQISHCVQSARSFDLSQPAHWTLCGVIGCTAGAGGFRLTFLVFLPPYGLAATGGKRISSHDLQRNKSPCVLLTYLSFAPLGHGPFGNPSQRGMVTAVWWEVQDEKWNIPYNATIKLDVSFAICATYTT